ncbi:MAG TPA: DUF6152 family protein [Vicinamibacterales bacterium]|nr:DUF6152 family protein [Vicinamibacterales bacterium]
MRLQIKIAIAWTVVAAGLHGTEARAHHSASVHFDLGKTVEYREATLTDVRLINPHLKVGFTIRGEDGKPIEMIAEGSDVTSFRRNGRNLDRLRTGEVVTVFGWPGRHDDYYMRVSRLTFADGETLNFFGADLGASGVRPPATTAGNPATDVGQQSAPRSLDDFEGIWQRVGFRPWLSADYPLNAEGRKLYEAFDATDDPVLLCKDMGYPRMVNRPSPLEIVIDDDTIYVLYEQTHQVRRIYRDGRPIKSDFPLSPLGFSIGRFLGDEVIIETRRLAPALLNGLGHPVSGGDTAWVEERWRILAPADYPATLGPLPPDARVLSIAVTLHDSRFYTAPVRVPDPDNYYVYAPNLTLLEDQCEY